MLRRLPFLFLLLCGACAARAVTLAAPPAISPAADGATVFRWKLDSPAGGRLRYGIAPDRLDQSAADEVGTDHALTLRGLRPGTQYFYSIGTAKHPLTTGSFIAGKVTQAPDAKPTVLQRIARIVAKPTEPGPVPTPVKITSAAPVSPKPAVHDAPSTRLIWGNLPSLPDHFARHGGDFGAKSPDDYAAAIAGNAPLWKVPAREVADTLAINVGGTANTIRHFVPAMIGRGRGVIVNFSSGWGRGTSPDVAIYCASKFAIEGLTQALAQELPRGVAAVAWNPGIINTGMLRSCFAGGASAYAKPAEWAKRSGPFLLGLTARDNGRSLDVPGVPVV